MTRLLSVLRIIIRYLFMYPLWKVDSSNQNYKGNVLLRTKYFNISFYLSENKSGKALLKHETSRCCEAIMFLQANTL